MRGTTPKSKKKVGEHKNIIKALNMFLSTIRSEKETLEWYIARFERKYAKVEKLGETVVGSSSLKTCTASKG